LSTKAIQLYSQYEKLILSLAFDVIGQILMVSNEIVFHNNNYHEV